MSQEDINDYLRKFRGKWFTSSQMEEALGISKGSMNRCLQRLKKHNEINGRIVRVMFKGKLGSQISKKVPFYSYKRV